MMANKLSSLRNGFESGPGEFKGRSTKEERDFYAPLFGESSAILIDGGGGGEAEGVAVRPREEELCK